MGMAFEVAESNATNVLSYLGIRESGGYEAVSVKLRFDDGQEESAITWIAGPSNDNFLGEASLACMVEQIRTSQGASGANSAYVLKLANALNQLQILDTHVQQLASGLKEHR